MNEMAIQTTKVTRRFGQQISVHEVSMNVKKGSIFGFLGLVGKGKNLCCLVFRPPCETRSGSLWEVVKHAHFQYKAYD
ncbi:MAG: hypothetical protein JWN30_854 [Bacilli bacterium]|nr:hypothetical protein [Bacilli bacterium]